MFTMTTLDTLKQFSRLISYRGWLQKMFNLNAMETQRNQIFPSYYKKKQYSTE